MLFCFVCFVWTLFITLLEILQAWNLFNQVLLVFFFKTSITRNPITRSSFNFSWQFELSGFNCNKSLIAIFSPCCRHPALRTVIDKPFNGEPPLELLTDKFLTPNDIFYVTNHLPVPIIDPEAYRLTVEGEGLNGTLKISLHDLKTQFPKHTVTATLQCAGNRRSEMNKIRAVQDAHWETGAISNATWGGALLRDVLSHAGCTESSAEAMGVRYIHFEGLDVDFSGEGYSTSIPVEKALSPTGDVLLAYEMNGKDLPPDHGYPLRVIVPGFVGARNVKWLGRIAVHAEENNSHWHKNDYKGVCPSEDWETVDFQAAAPILELPVTSAISKPYEGETVSADEGEITVKGYAWSGGGRSIVRVDVSIDGGKTWQAASLNQEETRPNRAWAWTLWETSIPLPEECGKLEVCCKAVDTSYNVQPDHVAPLWNLRGFLNNAWHRIHITVTPAEEWRHSTRWSGAWHYNQHTSRFKMATRRKFKLKKYSK